MRKLRDHIRGQLVGYVALFVALGGVSYATATLPNRSVGPPQLKPNAVTSPAVKDGSLRPGDLERGAGLIRTTVAINGLIQNPIEPNPDMVFVGPTEKLKLRRNDRITGVVTIGLAHNVREKLPTEAKVGLCYRRGDGPVTLLSHYTQGVVFYDDRSGLTASASAVPGPQGLYTVGACVGNITDGPLDRNGRAAGWFQVTG